MNIDLIFALSEKSHRLAGPTRSELARSDPNRRGLGRNVFLTVDLGCIGAARDIRTGELATI